jgi:hypothetical protein
MTSAVDGGEVADAVFLDFQKYKVPHKRLLEKLRAHGVTGRLLKWIAYRLSHRKQKVVLNGKFSG